MSWLDFIRALFLKCGRPQQRNSTTRAANALSNNGSQKTRFERRLEAALHPRWGKARNVKRKSDLSSRRSHLDAVIEDFHSLVHHKDASVFDPRHEFAKEVMTELSDRTKFLAAAAVAAGADVIESVHDKITDAMTVEERAVALAKRRKYYEAYNAKRRAESQFIASLSVAPENPCPTPEELLDAYRHRRDGEDATLRFGNLMIDLEEHVRHTIKTEGNKIVGASGGVRDWLEKNCPELAKHYHTCQRFKRKVQEGPCD